MISRSWQIAPTWTPIQRRQLLCSFQKQRQGVYIRPPRYTAGSRCGTHDIVDDKQSERRIVMATDKRLGYVRFNARFNWISWIAIILKSRADDEKHLEPPSPGHSTPHWSRSFLSVYSSWPWTTSVYIDLFHTWSLYLGIVYGSVERFIRYNQKDRTQGYDSVSSSNFNIR